MIELSLQNISKYYGATKVFENISFELHTKARVGLIGRNGCGKTTIFKIIAGLEDPNSGDLAFRKGTSVGYLDQMPVYVNKKGLEVLQLAFKDLYEMEKELKALALNLSSVEGGKYEKTLSLYGDKQVAFENAGGYDMHEKLERICSGFKFTKAFLDQDFERLSGGEKTRIVLARILLENPSILLLDEPSNHLDIDAVEWLENYLKDYEGSVLIISHDRYFLDHTVTEIYDLEGDQAHKYLGNYSYYVMEKERRMLEQLELYKKQQKKISAMEAAIKRFKDWGTRADNEKMFIKARSMEKRMDKMDKVDRPKLHHRKIALTFNESNRSGKEVVKISGLSKAFKDKVLFEQADLAIRYQDFVSLLGANGSGKSTLLNMILGKVSVDAGTIKLAESAKVGYMAQEIVFEAPEENILETLKEKYVLTEQETRNKLARFLFYADDVFKKVKNLSGGEKVRLALCMMMEEKINFLILDEPTNHVDIESREMVEQALRNFSGTILFISHDRYFIDQLATKVVKVEGYQLKTFDGDYGYYKASLEKNQVVKTALIKENKKQYKVRKEEKSGLNIFKQRQVEALEKRVEAQENLLISLNEALKNGTNTYEELMAIQSKIEEADKILQDLLDKWEKAQE